MNSLERIEYAGLLREGLWFRGLPEALQEAILERSTVRWFARGSMILLQDSPPEALYAVLQGQVAIERWATPDQHALIDVASPGTWFGELAVLLHTEAGDVRTGVEAVARTDARVLVLRLAAYDELIEHCPDHYRWFARLALERYDMCLRSETESRVLAAEELLTARLADLADMRHQDRAAATLPCSSSPRPTSPPSLAFRVRRSTPSSIGSSSSVWSSLPFARSGSPTSNGFVRSSDRVGGERSVAYR